MFNFSVKYQEITEEEKIIRPFSLSIKKLLEPLPKIDTNNFYEDNDNTLTSEKARDQLEKVITCYSQTTGKYKKINARMLTYNFI